MMKYQEVSPRDLSIDKEVTEENMFGQGSDVLPWFWHIGGVDLGSGADWTEEYKWSHSCEIDAIILYLHHHDDDRGYL